MNTHTENNQDIDPFLASVCATAHKKDAPLSALIEALTTELTQWRSHIEALEQQIAKVPSSKKKVLRVLLKLYQQTKEAMVLTLATLQEMVK